MTLHCKASFAIFNVGLSGCLGLDAPQQVGEQRLEKEYPFCTHPVLESYQVYIPYLERSDHIDPIIQWQDLKRQSLPGQPLLSISPQKGGKVYKE